MDKITIFTAGGFHPKTRVGSWSVVINQGDEQQILTGQVENTTSNQMELTAVIKALEWISLSGWTIEIFSDSEYVVRGANEWLENWVQNDWTTSTGKPVANQALWKELHGLLGRHRVSVSWVPRAQNLAQEVKP